VGDARGEAADTREELRASPIPRKKKRLETRATVGRLGKSLTRRSRGRWELCERRVGVEPHELGPWPEEPEIERTLMARVRCRTWLHLGETNPIEANVLGQAIWSTVRPVRLAAARLLIAIDDLAEPWVQDAL